MPYKDVRVVILANYVQKNLGANAECITHVIPKTTLFWARALKLYTSVTQIVPVLQPVTTGWSRLGAIDHSGHRSEIFKLG